MKRRSLLFLLLTTPLLGACKRNLAAEAPPRPREVPDAAVAYFCGMSLSEHSGPKAQIFVRGLADPYWFASVRDAFAFLMLPEMPKAITAVYVNDMARAENWEHPEPGVWVNARKAVFVIGSRRRSGMNTDEAIPFGNADAAQKFAAVEGGRAVTFDEMPHDYILASKSGEQ